MTFYGVNISSIAHSYLTFSRDRDHREPKPPDTIEVSGKKYVDSAKYDVLQERLNNFIRGELDLFDYENYHIDDEPPY